METDVTWDREGRKCSAKFNCPGKFLLKQACGKK